MDHKKTIGYCCLIFNLKRFAYSKAEKIMWLIIKDINEDLIFCSILIMKSTIAISEQLLPHDSN